MHKNLPVANLEINKRGHIEKLVNCINEEELPTGVSSDLDSINIWWKNNSIPVERDSIRLGLECLGISSTEELKILSHGLSLTNHYWIKEESSALTWEDVNFWDNGFSEKIGEALFNHKPLRKNDFIGMSPDTAENGMLKKRWINIDGNYYVQKKGSGLLSEEVFNEILASDLLDVSHVPHSTYKLKMEGKTPTCISSCITSKDTELVHFTQIIDSVKRKVFPTESEYKHFCNILDYYGVKNYEHNLQTRLAIGYVMADSDMHYNNLALLKTGNKYELAPFYDCGTSLYANKPTADIKPNDDVIMARPFCDKSTFGYWNRQKEFIEEYPDLTVSDLKNCIFNYIELVTKHSEYPRERIELLANTVMLRAYNLQKYLLQKGAGIKNDCLITRDDLKETQASISQEIQNILDNKQNDLAGVLTPEGEEQEN